MDTRLYSDERAPHRARSEMPAPAPSGPRVARRPAGRRRRSRATPRAPPARAARRGRDARAARRARRAAARVHRADARARHGFPTACRVPLAVVLPRERTGSYYTDAEDGRAAGAGGARLDDPVEDEVLSRGSRGDELAIDEVDADYARTAATASSLVARTCGSSRRSRARAEACAAYAAAADEVAGAEPEARAALTSDAPRFDRPAQGRGGHVQTGATTRVRAEPRCARCTRRARRARRALRARARRPRPARRAAAAARPRSRGARNRSTAPRKARARGGRRVAHVTDVARASPFSRKRRAARRARIPARADAAAGAREERARGGAPHGYRHVLVNVWVAGHLCELQLHLKPLYALRGGEAGRRLYRWFRRLELPHDLCARAMGRWALPILSR